MEPDQIKQLVTDEIKTAVAQFKTKTDNLNQEIEALKTQIAEAERFNKRLIAALQKAEKETDTYLLPTGEFYGVKID